LGSLLFLAACSSSGAALPPTRLAIAPYTLRTNDQLHIQVYGEPTITGDYTVDSTGYVSVPMAGRIRAAGGSTAQLERAIVAKLNQGVLKDAKVNVQVTTYSPFYIRGEVRKPGEFAYKPGMTIGDAVALAGGYTYRADESKVYLRPANRADEIVQPLVGDVQIAPGDNVRVPERWF
jgi:polysaccharide export outer membrane protein